MMINRKTFILFLASMVVLPGAMLMAQGRPDQGRGDQDRGGRGNRWSQAGGDQRSRDSRGSRGDDSSREDRRREWREKQMADYRSKVISQMKALDTNKNGRLEPTEANPLSIAVFQKVGLDSSKSIGLTALSSTVSSADLSRMKIDKDAKVTGDNLEQGVPGFGVSIPPPQPPGSFDISQHPALVDKRPLEERYTKDVINQVRSIIKSYDRNDNLMLDPNEIILVPWGNPSYKESDLDQNGYLTEIELCERIAARGNGYVKVDDSKNEADENRRGRSSRRPEIRTSEPVKKKARATMSADDRTAKYVRELINKYDEDKSGSLDSKEVEKMRAKPNEKADSDKDGLLTFEELYGHYSGGKKASKSQTSTSDLAGNIFWDTPLQKGKKEAKSSSYSSRRSSGSRSSSSRSSGKVPTIKFGIK